MSCSDDCLQCACVDLSMCKDIYFENWFFLWNTRLWCFNYFYGSLIIMLFSHDPWFVIGSASIVEVAKQLYISVSVSLHLPKLDIGDWQPGDMMLNMLYSILAAFCGACIIKIITPPRLLIFPKEDIKRIRSEYQININSNTIDNYTNLEIKKVMWKYFIEWIFWTFVFSMVFYIEKDDNILPSNYEPKCFRLDWILYFTLQILMIVVCYFLNRITRFENEIIWKNNTTKYNMFYAVLLVILVIIEIPSLCMIRQPKVMFFYTLLILISFLFILMIFSFIMSKFDMKNSMLPGRHLYGNWTNDSSVPRLIINEKLT